MHQTTPLLTLSTGWQKGISWVIRHLNQAGLQVVRSFDLQVARAAHLECNCPHHGTQLCDCQMVVLLVYDQQHPPAALVAHSRDGQTQLVLVDTPQQRPEHQLQQAIFRALQARNFGLPDREAEIDVT